MALLTDGRGAPPPMVPTPSTAPRVAPAAAATMPQQGPGLAPPRAPLSYVQQLQQQQGWQHNEASALEQQQQLGALHRAAAASMGDEVVRLPVASLCLPFASRQPCVQQPAPERAPALECVHAHVRPAGDEPRARRCRRGQQWLPAAGAAAGHARLPGPQRHRLHAATSATCGRRAQAHLRPASSPTTRRCDAAASMHASAATRTAACMHDAAAGCRLT